MVELKRTKEEVIKKAGDLGAEYESKYRGCAQCTFLAIVDALRWAGIEIILQDAEESLFSGLALLSGGVCITGDGSCGAVTGSILAIGIALRISREKLMDIGVRRMAYDTAKNAILDKYYAKYNSILCKDVQRKHFGKAWDLTVPEISEEFLKESGGCTIAQTAMWATECILDELEEGIW
jgi:hypothetical protein